MNNDFSPLMKLCTDIFREKDIIYLLKSGENPNYQSKTGLTALMLAAESSQEKYVEYLLLWDADPMLRNNLGMTALDYTTIGYEGDVKIREMLIQAMKLKSNV